MPGTTTMRGSKRGPSRPVRAATGVIRRRETLAVALFLVVSFVVSAEWTGVLAVPATAVVPAERSGATGVAPAAPTFPTPIQHVVVLMMENQDYTAVLQQGPFEAYLAKTYATATNDYALMHYSIPSYQAATSAVAYSNWTVGVRNLGDLADAAGLTWAAYLESMPTPCNQQLDWNLGYTPAHNPFTMYKDIVFNPLRCQTHDLTWTSWLNDVASGSLPNYAFVSPNTWHDDHNNSIAVGDAWLKSWLSPLINDSAIFSTTAFLLTFDESAGNPSNTPVVHGAAGGHVYTVVVSPYSRQLSSDRFYTTYSALTTAEWLLGLPGGTLGANDSWSVRPPMTDLFSFASPTSHDVTFTESGLPSGTSWSVTLGNATQSTTGSRLTFTEPDGTYAFSLGSVDGYGASPSSGTLTVHGSSVTRKVTFSPLTYGVTFSETGLPTETGWSVTFDGATQNSTETSLTFSRPGGTYAYRVGPVAGYTSSPALGSVEVTDAPVVQTITFTEVRYALTFEEAGLPPGTLWSVTLGDSTQSSSNATLTFHEPNGTHAYTIPSVPGYTPSPDAGSLEVAGADVAQSVAFTAVPYDVTFTEMGLPEGSGWSVTFAGTTQSSTGTTILFRAPNGTYPYTVQGAAGFSGPSSGFVTVLGSAVERVLRFAPVIYSVTISEQGLPSGTAWSFTLDGFEQNTSNASLTFPEPNGTFAYTVGPVAGYLPAPRTGSVTVNGSAVALIVPFSPVTYAVTFAATGLPTGAHWTVTVDGIAKNATDARLSFQEPNGTFRYAAVSPDGFVAAPAFVTVAGGPTEEEVPFVAVTYPLSFSAEGLPTGTNWSVTLTSAGPATIRSAPSSTEPPTESGSLTRWSEGASTVPFDASNGSYTFVASAPGYGSLAGNLTVRGGSGTPVALAFSPIPSRGAFPSGWELGLVVPTVLGLVAAAAAAAVIVLRRPRPPRTASGLRVR